MPRSPTSLRWRFQTSLALLILAVVGSTIGFRILELPGGDWSKALWDTLNVVSTVGNLGQLSALERLWAMIVMVLGLGAVLYGFGNLTAMLTSGEILHVYEGRKMQRRIESLSGHVILCGFGNTGRMVADRLRRFDIPFVVIERDPRQAEEARADGWLVVEDDCTHEEALELGGVERARVLVTAVESDADNVFVVLTAKGMSPNIQIVARAIQPTTVSKLKRAGADHVTVPNQIAAYQLADLAVRPEIGSFISSALGGDEFELLELSAADHSWMCNKTIRDLNLTRRADVIVFSLVREGEDAGRHFNPSPDMVVGAGDTLLVVARGGARDRLSNLD